ncbi:MAG TPA: lysophospholipid acyltransferase family protein [Pyrinomonadaceae bacterium]|nr:lysophospholipid acyltransferase family protein [Pyrinomonadaceae bacterium]
MTRHSRNPLPEPVDESLAIDSSQASESNILGPRTLSGRLLYYWSLFMAAMLLLILGPPSILVCWLAGHPEWLYPWALFGGRNWLRLSGMKVVVRGLEHLDPKQTYVFIANHRSYLDTATLFCHLGRRIGLLAKKELLKVPIMGQGMGFVNVMAIDRSNRERALQTTHAAKERIRSGMSFGVFAEGTRSLPGQLLPFKKGGFYMAVETGVPIIPVAIKHTDGLMGKGTGQATPGIIEMVLLEPVETHGLSTDEQVSNLTNHVRALIGKELGIGDRR